MAVDSGPSSRSAAVTAHDSNAQPVGRALFVGTGGDIAGRLVGDTSDRAWKNVGDGDLLPFQFSYIRSTGTTAADMVIQF